MTPPGRGPLRFVGIRGTRSRLGVTGSPGRRDPEGCHGFPGTPRTFGGYGGPFEAPHLQLGSPRFPDLVAVAVAVRARQQGRPAAVTAEVPGFVTLTVVRPGVGNYLGRV